MLEKGGATPDLNFIGGGPHLSSLSLAGTRLGKGVELHPAPIALVWPHRSSRPSAGEALRFTFDDEGRAATIRACVVGGVTLILIKGVSRFIAVLGYREATPEMGKRVTASVHIPSTCWQPRPSIHVIKERRRVANV